MSPLARVQLVRAIHVCPPKREILRSEKVSWNDSRGSRRDMLYIETEEGEGELDCDGLRMELQTCSGR